MNNPQCFQRKQSHSSLAHRRSIFDAVHGLAHAGTKATKRLISSRYVWLGLAADIRTWCKECLHCQRAKVTRQPAAAVEAIPNPTARFTSLHIDLVGPLPVSAEGYSHLLTIVDRSTRWFEALPLRSTTAEACVAAVVAGWISRYSTPVSITSDRGSQFVSSLWSSLSASLGIRHRLTTPYHPQSNGAVERFHRRLKEALRARLAAADWPSHLPWVLLGLRAAPREDSGVSAAELVFGAPLTLPGALFAAAEPPPAVFPAALRAQLPVVAPLPVVSSPSPAAKTSLEALMAAEFVFVRLPPVKPPLAPAYKGPYRVERRSAKVFILAVGGRFEAHTVDRLKPCFAPSPTPALPPRCGRPRKAVTFIVPSSFGGSAGGGQLSRPISSTTLE